MRMCPSCGVRFTNEAAFCPHDGSSTKLADEAPEAVDPLLGQVLDGRYRIENVLGEGGMGVVYRATHEVLGKSMAIKVLRGEAAKDPDTVKRFIQEAQASSTIGHPNIVSISDFGHLPDGAAYFVMEHLEGETLTDLMRREAPLSPRGAAKILRGIGAAMAAAHARGIIHRDLKPDNVFMAQLGEAEPVVKILDFGIAKVGGAQNKLTRTGMIFGTPHYIAPEQAAGEAVDARTDIYALGVIAYELITGSVPFEGDTFMGILGKHMFEAPTPPTQLAGLATALEPLVLRALAKKPEERYPDVDALLEDLDRRIDAAAPGFSGEHSAQGAVMDAAIADRRERAVTAATPSRPSEDIQLPTGRGPLYALAAATALVAIAAVVGAISAFGSSEPAASELASTTPTPVVVDAGSPTPDVAPATAPAPARAMDPLAPIRVHVESRPAGASVYEGDVLLGNAPMELPVTESPRLLTLRLGGRSDAQVQVSSDSPSSIVVELGSSRHPRPARPTPPAVEAVMAPVMRRAPHMRPRPRHHPTVQSTEVVDPWANN